MATDLNFVCGKEEMNENSCVELFHALGFELKNNPMLYAGGGVSATNTFHNEDSSFKRPSIDAYLKSSSSHFSLNPMDICRLRNCEKIIQREINSLATLPSRARPRSTQRLSPLQPQQYSLLAIDNDDDDDDDDGFGSFVYERDDDEWDQNIRQDSKTNNKTMNSSSFVDTDNNASLTSRVSKHSFHSKQ